METLKPDFVVVGASNMWKLSEQEKEEVCLRYAAGATTPQLAGDYGVSDVAIGGILRRRGVRMRTNSEAQRKYSLQEDVFSGAGEASMYWAGFLMADGCVFKRKGASAVVSLKLGHRDSDHVRRFRDFVGFDGPVGEDAKGVSIQVHSNRLAKDLAKFGVVPRKSLAATALRGADNRHFWRGVVDGDGSIGAYGRMGRNGSWNRTLRLCGAEPLLDQFLSFLREHGVETQATVRPHKTIFGVSLVGKPASQAARLLYGGATIALPRKVVGATNIAIRPSNAKAVAARARVNVPDERGDDSKGLSQLRPTPMLKLPTTVGGS